MSHEVVTLSNEAYICKVKTSVVALQYALRRAALPALWFLSNELLRLGWWHRDARCQ